MSYCLYSTLLELPYVIPFKEFRLLYSELPKEVYVGDYTGDY